MKFLMFMIVSLVVSAQAHAFEYTCEAAVTVKEDGKVPTTMPIKTALQNEYSNIMYAERTKGMQLAIQFGGYDYEATDVSNFLDKYGDTTVLFKGGNPLQRLPDGTLTLRYELQFGEDGKTLRLNYEMICKESPQN